MTALEREWAAWCGLAMTMEVRLDEFICHAIDRCDRQVGLACKARMRNNLRGWAVERPDGMFRDGPLGDPWWHFREHATRAAYCWEMAEQCEAEMNGA